MTHEDLNATTPSHSQFNFDNLVSHSINLCGISCSPRLGVDKLTVEDMIGAATHRPPGGISRPYLRQRSNGHSPAGDSGEKKEKFFDAPGDGPGYRIGKAQRPSFFHANAYGKDVKGPPHSYLPIRDCTGAGSKSPAGKKEAKSPASEQKKALGGRGSFIDAIFFSEQKYKFPGPSSYFKELPGTKKKEEKKAEPDADKKKQFLRLNFLCDAEYLGMNTQSPGAYNSPVIFPRHNIGPMET